jgi:hypothetical protein
LLGGVESSNCRGRRVSLSRFQHTSASKRPGRVVGREALVFGSVLALVVSTYAVVGVGVNDGPSALASDALAILALAFDGKILAGVVEADA